MIILADNIRRFQIFSYREFHAILINLNADLSKLSRKRARALTAAQWSVFCLKVSTTRSLTVRGPMKTSLGPSFFTSCKISLSI